MYSFVIFQYMYLRFLEVSVGGMADNLVTCEWREKTKKAEKHIQIFRFHTSSFACESDRYWSQSFFFLFLSHHY